MYTDFKWGDIISVATTLFFVMDSLGNIPAFQSILKNFDIKTRIRIIFRELLIALAVLLIVLLAGVKIMSFLGLSQPSLNIAGGILLFIIAIRMVFPSEKILFDSYDSDPLVVPLAIPLIAGPSAIAVLLFLSSSQPKRIMEWSLSLLIAWSLTTVILVLSPYMLRYLGDKFLRATERLMGMLLILIAIQMFLDGLSQFLRTNI